LLRELVFKRKTTGVLFPGDRRDRSEEGESDAPAVRVMGIVVCALVV
jgi:hypothetical protein